jgi:hypothetical protein
MAEKLVALLHIPQVSGSIISLGPGHMTTVSWFSADFPRKWQYLPRKGHKRFLPDPVQFIVHKKYACLLSQE